MYIEAASQNAFDTAAGMGLFSAYAAYFSRKTGAVRYGCILPFFNNLVRYVGHGCERPPINHNLFPKLHAFDAFRAYSVSTEVLE